MANNLCLEIQPDCYTVVVGPTFATKVVREILDDGDEVKLPTFEFRSIVDHGVSYLLDKETFTSDSERAKFEARYKNAYELDPGFVLRKIISNLQTAGYYKEWLAELFACNIHARKESKSLQCLLTLQRQGALLVYVHCDDIIACVAGLEPVLLENEKQMEQWAKGECAGFLQLHGIYSKPDTVQLDCQLYDSAPHPLHSRMQRLKQFLCNRSTILLGDDWDRLSSEPLLSNFCERFVNESTERHSFVSSIVDTCLPALHIRSIPTVLPLTERTAKLWKQIHVVPTSPSQSCQHQVVCLLVSSQDGARDISHMMFNAPGVNFALVNPVMYGNALAYCVSLRVASDSLHQLWHWLVSSSQEALLAHGLMAVALKGGTFLWLRDPSIINGGQGHSNTLSAADRNVTSTSSPHVSAQDTSSSHQRSGGDLRPNRIIERYKVVKKRNQIVGGGHSDVGPYGSHFMSKAADDPGLLLSHHVAHNKYARRGSLPPIKCGESGNALALLAERLQTTSDGGSSQIPSYVAIKRALLSDKFKHMQNPISRLVVPKMLLNLLQAKKLSVIEEKPNLLAHRRNSDPGSYLQHRDKARRRQLFLDENMLWSKTYGSVIEKKIQSWKHKRLLRLQRDYFYSQQKELHLMNSAAAASQLVPSPLCSSLASSTNSSSLPQAYVAAAGINGFSPAPLMYQLPSTGLTPASVLVPSPFISPYAFMGSYTTLPVTAATQPTTAYILPPTALTAGAQQKVVFLPPASSAMATGDSASTTNAPDSTPDTKPPFSSLLAPTPLSAPYIKPQSETSQHTSPQATNSLGSRKRKSTVPEKLSSLLQPPLDHNPESSPATKKFCNTEHSSALYTAQDSSPSSHSHSSLHTHNQQTHHLSHSHNHHHRHRHRHRHHHHSHHHSSSTDSHHHHYSSHSHRHCSSPSPPPQHPHSRNSPSPLEQRLLQPSQSPKSTGESPEGSPCSFSSSSPTDCSGRDHPQLWQFLLELLLSADCSHLIEWTDSGQEYEFTIRDPVQVAQLWGKCTNNSAMNYDKLARGLRYYYSKGIIGKVDGKTLTFQYNGLAKSYVQRRCGKAVDVMSSVEEMVVVE